MILELPTRRSTIRFAQRLAPLLEAGDLVVLSGELGAGKTFMVRALCRALGLPERQRVTSPTFSLVHEYATTPAVSHADLYRVEQQRDVRELGLDAQRSDGRLCLVEWGERWISPLGGDALVLELSTDPRRVQLRSTGPRSAKLLNDLEST